MFGGGDQPLALVCVHAFQGAAPGLVPAAANFDEYYCIAVQHDQIELAAAAPPVLRQQAQAMALQVLAGELLGAAPEFLRVAAPSAQRPPFSSGCAWPLRNSAQGSWRWMRWLGARLRLPVKPSSCMLGSALSSGRRGARR